MFRFIPVKGPLIYAATAAVTVVLSFVTLILVSTYAETQINLSVEMIQFFNALVALAGLTKCILKRKDLLLPKIIFQSLICFVLGELYWVLHIYIRGYEQAGVFSISDISWLGFYFFLLAACRNVFHRNIDFKDNQYRKINIISLFAPAFIIGINMVLFLTGDSLFYTIIYTIPTAFLGYYTLRLVLTSFKNEILKSFRTYHMTVGLILLLDNLACLALNLGFEDAEYIFKFCFALLLLLITPAVYKGVQK
ncbi:MAG: hypothetical protein PHR18_03280 [Oscillospiraceae bacterium]|nr:hypothetical protein [Oscillospiraceae bacterium]MDD4402495.1 hypothetical protein [Desulfitobacteriaceae bacterium]